MYYHPNDQSAMTGEELGKAIGLHPRVDFLMPWSSEFLTREGKRGCLESIEFNFWFITQELCVENPIQLI